MGIARKLEAGLERLVDGMSSAVFRGKPAPGDLGRRLVRFADLNFETHWTGAYIPNVYRLSVLPADLPDRNMDEAALRALGAELAHALRVAAEQTGWATRGPISVTVERAAEDATKTTVEADSRPAAMRPWGQLIGVKAGEVLRLTDNRIGIGRADDATVRLDNAEVSRRHAVIAREEGRVLLEDLTSTNGTWHNGTRVEIRTPIQPGDTVRFGPLSYTFRLA